MRTGEELKARRSSTLDKTERKFRAGLQRMASSSRIGGMEGGWCLEGTVYASHRNQNEWRAETRLWSCDCRGADWEGRIKPARQVSA